MDEPVSLALVRAKQAGPVVVLGAHRGYAVGHGLEWEADDAHVWSPTGADPTYQDREIVRRYLTCALGWSESLGDRKLTQAIQKTLKVLEGSKQ